jgi:hypothetical protein
MGWAKQHTGNFSLGLSLTAVMLVLGGISVIMIGRAFFRDMA